MHSVLATLLILLCYTLCLAHWFLYLECLPPSAFLSSGILLFILQDSSWYLFFREGNALLIDFRVKTKVPSLPYKGLWSWIDPSSLSILSTSSRPDVSTSCPCSYALFILSLLFRDSYLLPHPYLYPPVLHMSFKIYYCNKSALCWLFSKQKNKKPHKKQRKAFVNKDRHRK